MHDTKTSLPQPPGWADNELCRYFDKVQGNLFATFANKPIFAMRLSGIDSCFSAVTGDLKDIEAPIGGLLMIRAHSSFRVSSLTAMAGTVQEAFPLLRNTLEYAAYAFYMWRKPQLVDAWVEREDNETARKLVRKHFKMPLILAELENVNAPLRKRMEEMYEDTITEGAHPNINALVSGMQALESPGERTFVQVTLHSDGVPLEHGLVCAGRTGVIALEIFEEILRDRFIRSRASEKLIDLRKGLTD